MKLFVGIILFMCVVGNTLSEPTVETKTSAKNETEKVLVAENDSYKDADGNLKICGYCKVECNKTTGACKGGCDDGWTGDKCDKPTCEGGCNSGTCIAPDTCFCGEDINLDRTLNCTDIRMRGLCGSAAALVILTLVVFLCSSVSKSVRRKERARLAELQKDE